MDGAILEYPHVGRIKNAITNTINKHSCSIIPIYQQPAARVPLLKSTIIRINKHDESGPSSLRAALLLPPEKHGDDAPYSPASLALETVQHNVLLVADLLIGQELHHHRSLISRQLDDLIFLLVLLHCPIAREILLEGLANALNVQVVGEASDGGDTLAPVALLDANVDFLVGALAALVLGRVVEGVEGVELHASIPRANK